jgi:hypothetical protein
VIRFLSLFSGIGGKDLGLERAGMECVGQVEIDLFCRLILEKHWPLVPKWGNIRNFRRLLWERYCDANGLDSSVDLICGGFPCQDISFAGADGSWLRTFLLSELAGRTSYSLLWRESVTPAGRSWWVLGRAARPKSATESGSSAKGWATPTASIYTGGAPQDSKGKRDLRLDLLKVWPTPTVCGNYNRAGASGKSGDGLATAASKVWQTPSASSGQAGCRSRSGKRKGELLLAGQAIEATRKWPTPMAADAMMVKYNGVKDGVRNPSLGMAAGCWPTPAAWDWKQDGSHPAAQDRRSPCLPAATVLAGRQDPTSPSEIGNLGGCLLNSHWVATLMGFPRTWCDLITVTHSERSGTRLSPTLFSRLVRLSPPRTLESSDRKA